MSTVESALSLQGSGEDDPGLSIASQGEELGRGRILGLRFGNGRIEANL